MRRVAIFAALLLLGVILLCYFREYKSIFSGLVAPSNHVSKTESYNLAFSDRDYLLATCFVGLIRIDSVNIPNLPEFPELHEGELERTLTLSFSKILRGNVTDLEKKSFFIKKPADLNIKYGLRFNEKNPWKFLPLEEGDRLVLFGDLVEGKGDDVLEAVRRIVYVQDLDEAELASVIGYLGSGAVGLAELLSRLNEDGTKCGHYAGELIGKLYHDSNAKPSKKELQNFVGNVDISLAGVKSLNVHLGRNLSEFDLIGVLVAASAKAFLSTHDLTERLSIAQFFPRYAKVIGELDDDDMRGVRKWANLLSKLQRSEPSNVTVREIAEEKNRGAVEMIREKKRGRITADIDALLRSVGIPPRK